MKMTSLYVPTLKEAPGDAEVVSHKLLIRAGFIRKLTSGIYVYLPMAWRALGKISAIVREEMTRAGAQEILMPMVQPGDLWKETGRWEFYGKELLRFKDRHDRDYCLGPTHEEVVTDLVRGEVNSYRQLPLNLFQIQTKFRDEIRPRFGLMRGREFIMKDAYSFDMNEEGADKSYWAMHGAYTRIFSRLGLKFRAVEADTGSIGGNFSHEFMVLAETGEDTIAFCSQCEWAANLEKAQVKAPADAPAARDEAPAEVVATPSVHTVEEVAAFLKVAPSAIVKTLLFDADGVIVAALVRGDRDLNEIKLKNHLNAAVLTLAQPEVVARVTGAPVGFAGPVGLKVARIVIDHELQGASGCIVGANQADAHLLHVDLARDLDAALVAYTDLRTITAGDPCPACGGGIDLAKGIEVGHVFKLGLKYSEAMNAKFLDENGKERFMIMGCYGIGVSRILAACIEQNHDADGIVFPPPVAPFEVAVLSLAGNDETVAAKAEEIYELLVNNRIDTLLDDRAERPGVKFKDADLIGTPIQLVVGGKALARGVVEVKNRRTGEKSELPVDNFLHAFSVWRQGVLDCWTC
ncbi:proline--tRNA ligase [Megalodesulfovibrio paquesii]